jgi:hypothetical protein
MMKVKEIYKLALNRTGQREGDRQIENIMMAGINAAYKLIAIKNKKTKTADIMTVVNTPLPLPEDFISLVMLIKEGIGGGRLSKNEYYIDSDIILVTNPDMLGALSIIYNYIPVDLDLVADAEVEPTIQKSYHSALSAYAAYYFYNHINNYNAATMCLNEFNSITGLAEQTEFERTNSPLQTNATDPTQNR